ncbi:hypothetical protein H4R99_007266 [Coemansia sp. RSA 1722]|nr:hypothetical protein IWW45_005678 [Coemansia sp. RSA 485]KAJ2589977.1 hypothetical protein H4R99_007266 [Coemansia sp. RSA 1722]
MCFILTTDSLQYGSELAHPLTNWKSLSVFARLYRTAGRTDQPIGRHLADSANKTTIQQRQRKRRRRQCVLETLTETEPAHHESVEQTPLNRRHEPAATPGSTARQIVPRAEECWPLTMLVEKYPELRYERWLPKTLRNAKRTGGNDLDERFLRGTNGFLLCLWCGKETGSKKKLFCAAPRGNSRRLTTGFGEGCEHEHRMRRDNQYVRDQLKMRDRGVCCYCSAETHELYLQATKCQTIEARNKMFKELAKDNPEWLKKVRRPLASMEYGFNEGMFWEAAHRIDVKHGGGLCGLDGYNTLCVPCHNVEYMRNYMTNLSTLPLYQSPQPDAAVATPRPAEPRPKLAASTGRLRKPAQTRSAPRTVQTSLRSAVAFVSPMARKPSRPQNLFKELSFSSSGSLPSPTSFLLRGAADTRHMETPSKHRVSGGLVDLTSSTETSMLAKGNSSKRASMAKISPIRISSDEYSDDGEEPSDSESSGCDGGGRRVFPARSPASTMSEYSSYSRGGGESVQGGPVITTRTTARVSRTLFSAPGDSELFAKVTVRRGKRTADKR